MVIAAAVEAAGRWLWWGALAALTLVVCVRAFDFPSPWVAAALIALVPALIAGVSRFLRPPTLIQAAARLDDRLQLKDRLGTGIAISGNPTNDPFTRIALEDAQHAAANARTAAAAPIRPHWQWWGGAAAVIMMCAAGFWLPPFAGGWAERAAAARQREKERLELASQVAAATAALKPPESADQPPAATPEQIRTLEEIRKELESGVADPRTASARAAAELARAADTYSSRADSLQDRAQAVQDALRTASGADDHHTAGSGGPEDLAAALRRADLDSASRALAAKDSLTPAERDRLADRLQDLADDLRSLDDRPQPSENPQSTDNAQAEPRNSEDIRSLTEDLSNAARELRETSSASPNPSRPDSARDPKRDPPPESQSPNPGSSAQPQATAPKGASGEPPENTQPKPAPSQPGLGKTEPKADSPTQQSESQNPPQKGESTDEHKSPRDSARGESTRSSPNQPTPKHQGEPDPQQQTRQPSSERQPTGAEQNSPTPSNQTQETDAGKSGEPRPQQGQPAQTQETGAQKPSDTSGQHSDTQPAQPNPSAKSDKNNSPENAQQPRERSGQPGSSASPSERPDGQRKTESGSAPKDGSDQIPQRQPGNPDRTEKSPSPSESADAKQSPAPSPGSKPAPDPSPSPSQQPSDSQPTNPPDQNRAAEKLAERLNELRDLSKRAADDRRAADDLRSRAQEMLQSLDPSDRDRLKQAAKQASSKDPRNTPPSGNSAGIEPGRDARRSASAPADPAQTELVDARRPPTAAEHATQSREQVVAEWLGPGQKGGGSSTPSDAVLQQAARSAERAVDDRTIPPRFDRLIERYFRRLPERLREPRADQPNLPPVQPAQDAP